MKNTLIVVCAVMFSLFTCSLFMETTSDEIPVVNTNDQIKAFQIGSYVKKENVEDKSGLIVFDGEKYNVYYSILSNSKNIAYMISYLNKHKIKYYLKNINVSNNFQSELDYYEKLMLETASDVAFLELNNKILKAYEVLK